MQRLTSKKAYRQIIYKSFYNLFFTLSIRRKPIYKTFIVKKTNFQHFSIKYAKNLVDIVIFY